MFYYSKDEHKLLEGKLKFKEHNYMFYSYEMELYSAGVLETEGTLAIAKIPGPSRTTNSSREASTSRVASNRERRKQQQKYCRIVMGQYQHQG
jgi:hypothetical protein